MYAHNSRDTLSFLSAALYAKDPGWHLDPFVIELLSTLHSLESRKIAQCILHYDLIHNNSNPRIK